MIVFNNESWDFLCQYRKRTDIYYSTWSFENVAKNCQFQFLDPPQNCQFQFLDPPPPPKILLPVSELPVSVFRPPTPKLPVSVFKPPQILLPVSVFRPPKLPVSVFRPPKILLPVSVLDHPPPNIVKGNGVVFENFMINHF